MEMLVQRVGHPAIIRLLLISCTPVFCSPLTLAPVKVELGDTTATLIGQGLSDKSVVKINNSLRSSVFLQQGKQETLNISLDVGDAVPVGQTATVTVTNPDSSVASTT